MNDKKNIDEEEVEPQKEFSYMSIGNTVYPRDELQSYVDFVSLLPQFVPTEFTLTRYCFLIFVLTRIFLSLLFILPAADLNVYRRAYGV